MPKNYKEEDVRAFANAVVEGVDAAKDGIGVEDTAAAMKILTSLASAANEIKDTDVFLLHFVSELTAIIADRRLAAKIAELPPAAE